MMPERADGFFKALCASRAALKLNQFDMAEAAIAEALKEDPLRAEIAKEAELAALLIAWRALPIPRPDFLSFAHKRREASRI